MSAHIEKRILPLFTQVMISKRRIKPDTGVQQRLEWLFESVLVRFGGAVAVIVVAEHQDEVERKFLALRGELTGCLLLFSAPPT